MNFQRWTLILVAVLVLGTGGFTLAEPPASMGEGWLAVEDGVWMRISRGGERIETWAEGETSRELALDGFQSSLPAIVNDYLAEPSGENRETLDHHLAAIRAAEGGPARSLAGGEAPQLAPPLCPHECDLGSMVVDAQPVSCGARASAVGWHENYCNLTCYLTANVAVEVTRCDNSGTSASDSCSVSGDDLSCDLLVARKAKKNCLSAASMTLYCPVHCLGGSMTFTVYDSSSSCGSPCLCLSTSPEAEE